MKFRFSTLLILVAAVSAIGAQVTSHAPTALAKVPAHPASSSVLKLTDKPVARVNGAVLTTSDLVREEFAIFPYARQHNGIPKEFEKQVRDGALKMIVFEELVYQEALRRKVTVSPTRMQRAESDFKKQFSTPDEFNSFLQSDFRGSRQLLQAKIQRSLLIEALLKTEVEDKSVVTPAEVRALYDKNPARFRHPETYMFQTISVLPPANPTSEQLKEARARAERGLHQAKATRTADEFGLLAEKISDDDYHVMMGQHKPVPVEQLAPQVVKALQLMHPNEVSDLIQIEQAFTIVRLQVHAPAGQTKFTEVKPQLTRELQQSKKNQLRSALDQKLRQTAKVDEL